MQKDKLIEVAKTIAIRVASNASVAPELCFPHIYLGLKDLLEEVKSTPVQAQEPVGCANPEAVFAMFCEQRGYPSDGEWDGPMRAAFNCGMDFCESTASRLEPTSDRAPVQPVAVAVPDAEFLSWILKDRIDMWESYITNVTRMKADGFPIGGTDEDDCKLKVERAKNLLAQIAAPAAQGDAKDAERWREFERALRTGHFQGAGHGRRFKIIETCPMYGDEKEFNDFIRAIDAAIAAKAAS